MANNQTYQTNFQPGQRVQLSEQYARQTGTLDKRDVIITRVIDPQHQVYGARPVDLSGMNPSTEYQVSGEQISTPRPTQSTPPKQYLFPVESPSIQANKTYGSAGNMIDPLLQKKQPPAKIEYGQPDASGYAAYTEAQANILFPTENKIGIKSQNAMGVERTIGIGEGVIPLSGLESMQPTLSNDDKIGIKFLEPLERGSLSVGDIVLYSPTAQQRFAAGTIPSFNSYLIHRVKGVEKDASGKTIGYTLQGDNPFTNSMTDNQWFGNSTNNATIQPFQIAYLVSSVNGGAVPQKKTIQDINNNSLANNGSYKITPQQQADILSMPTGSIQRDIVVGKGTTYGPLRETKVEKPFTALTAEPSVQSANTRNKNVGLIAGDVSFSSSLNNVGTTAKGFVSSSIPGGTLEATTKLTGFDKTYADAFQARKEAELGLFKVGAGTNEILAFGAAGGVLAGARFVQNVINIPGSIVQIATNPVGVISSLPQQFSEYRQEPILLFSDIGFAYATGKVGQKVIGSAKGKVETGYSNLKTSLGKGSPTSIKINPTISQNVFLTKTEVVGIAEEGGSTTHILRGQGRIVTKIDSKTIPQGVMFESTSVGNDVRAISVSKGTIETPKAETLGFTGVESSFRTSPVTSNSLAVARSFALKKGKIIQKSESAGGFKITKVSDITFPDSTSGGFNIEGLGTKRESFLVKGVTGTQKVGKNELFTGTVSGAIEINERFLKDSVAFLENKGSTKSLTTSPRAQTLLETISPLAKEQALSSVSLDKPLVRVPDFFDNQVSLTSTKTSFSSPLAPIQLYDKRYDSTGFGGAGGISITDVSFNTNILSTGKTPGFSSALFTGTKTDILSGTKQSNKTFFNIDTSILSASRTSERTGLDIGQILNIRLDTGSRQQEKLSFKTFQNTKTRQGGRTPTPPLMFFNAPIGAFDIGDVLEETPRKKSRRIRKSPKIKTEFTPSLTAIEFDISGVVDTGATFTGTEIRPKARRRK